MEIIVRERWFVVDIIFEITDESLSRDFIPFESAY